MMTRSGTEVCDALMMCPQLSALLREIVLRDDLNQLTIHNRFEVYRLLYRDRIQEAIQPLAHTPVFQDKELIEVVYEFFRQVIIGIR